jgi:hypothetical protein
MKDLPPGIALPEVLTSWRLVVAPMAAWATYSNILAPIDRIVARFELIDRSDSHRLTQVSFKRHFALATPCAHVPGRYAEPSHHKIGIAPAELGHRLINQRGLEVVRYGR